MIAFDSSVWIELWRDPACLGQVRAAAREHGGDPDQVIVPATAAYETQRWLIRNVDGEALIAALSATMDEHLHVGIDVELARRAAVVSIATGLAAADATILAAARSRQATLLTFDADFAGIPDVIVLERS